MPVGLGSGEVARAHWPDLALSAVLAVSVVVAALVTSERSGENLTLTWPSAWVECLVFVSAAAVAVARWTPVPALAGAAVLDAMPFWLPIGGFGYHWAVMICAYTVTARCPWRRAGPVVAALIVVQTGLMAYDMDWRWHSFYVASAAFTTALPSALGAAVQAREVAVVALREQAAEAKRSREADARELVAQDRLRTARDLHDTVAHQIAVMNLNAGVASAALRTRPNDAERALVTVREAGRAVIASISDLLTKLREDDDDRGPEARTSVAELRELVNGFRALTPRLSLVVDGAETEDDDVSPVVYAVTREALTNAYKHGDRDEEVRVEVHLAPGSCDLLVVNRIHDRGQPSGGFGLQGMHERVAAVGGTLDVSAEGDAFDVRAHVPRVGSLA